MGPNNTLYVVRDTASCDTALSLRRAWESLETFVPLPTPTAVALGVPHVLWARKRKVGNGRYWNHAPPALPRVRRRAWVCTICVIANWQESPWMQSVQIFPTVPSRGSLRPRAQY